MTNKKQIPRYVETIKKLENIEKMINALEKEHKKLIEMQDYKIVRCKDCKHSEYDTIFGDRYCHYNGKAEIVQDKHFCGYGEEIINE